MAKAIAVTETRTTPQWRQQPERFWNFLKEVRSELHKVVVPSRKKFGRRQRWSSLRCFCSLDISGWWTRYLTG